MNKPKSSLIVSPNLGCPEIVSVPAMSDRGFRVIIAAPVSEDFDATAHTLSASPSFGGQGQDFTLKLTGARKLEDEALPSRFENVGETRLLISTTLRTELFPKHAFWEVWAKPRPPIGEQHLRTVNRNPRPTLYDLALSVHGVVVGRVKHALCLRAGDSTVKFVHLTDLHVAARNDMWEAEVHAVIEGSPVTPDPQHFNNFNMCLRKFIQWANQQADEGQLDFVFMLGDLVDFNRTGLLDRTPDDSNWSALIEILSNKEKGLRVPIFTTTGNHDWRTFPYSPVFRLDLFGITKKCAEELDFWYRNTSVEIGKKLEEVQQKLISKGSPLLARSWWGAITGMGYRGVVAGWQRLWQRTSAVIVQYGRQLMWAFLTAWFGINNISGAKDLKWSVLEQRFSQWFHHPSWPPHFVLWLVVLACALLITLVAPSRLYAWLRTTLEGLIAIEAEVSTISEYFLRVNPYFNYAFQLENCYFIVLDTGPDCLTAQSFWDDGGKKVRRISIGDNILGGSPDTMGFYLANEFYPYSQISWLENVLSCIGESKQQDAAHPERRRIFVGLHAPPANLSPKKREQAKQQLKLNEVQNKPYVLMEEAPFGGCDLLDGYDIRYGTVNHYLSQFFYLCLGYREGEQNKFTGPGVDAVFAGHAHWNMEFQLRRPQDAGSKWSPELLYGKFSYKVEATCQDDPDARWGPLLLQTAACGPQGGVPEEVPPNFRYVTVDGNGAVCNLRPRTLKQPPEPGGPKGEGT
jgi:hypothetical protein